MNRNEYLMELRHRLRRLPQEEFDSAIMYYEEYFDDAGIEKEQEVIANLGTPAALAGQLIGEFAIKEPIDGTTPTAKKSANKIWIGVLALFASPIALPISIAVAAVVFALVVSLGAVLFAFGITGIGLLISGAVVAILGLTQITTITFGALVYMGGGLIVFALGIMFSLLAVTLFRATFNGLAKLVGKVLVGRKSKQQREEMH